MKFLMLLISLNIFAYSIGDKVSDFKLVDHNGKEVSLSNHKGNFVVLEWYNMDCPFVRKHYDSSNMQNLQKKYTEKGVKWLTIISSAPGKQGHLKDSSIAMNQYKKENMNSDALLLDPSGEVGKMFQAKTTPHMYILDKDQELLYQGAIDSISSYDKDDISRSTNYVDKALGELLSGKKIATNTTKAYGCSVKY